jgi:hypothetical protein
MHNSVEPKFDYMIYEKLIHMKEKSFGGWFVLFLIDNVFVLFTQMLFHIHLN